MIALYLRLEGETLFQNVGNMKYEGGFHMESFRAA